jgi:hypothetical protein
VLARATPSPAWMSELAAGGPYAQINGELLPSAGLVRKNWTAVPEAPEPPMHAAKTTADVFELDA